ncbi:PEGA domain-containing protein, partial [Candidatus Woesearchaeota archaeon]|nr:PEGA domain-containing protein [Candidatus Woesearchaeota archaeon]
MRNKKILFFVVLFSFLIPTIVFAAGLHSLTVYVYDENYDYATANITLYDSSNEWMYLNNNVYPRVIRDIPSGIYTLQVEKAGYNTYTQAIRIEQDRSKNVYLKVFTDTKSPAYSSCTVSPVSPVTYSTSQVYEFKCTWIDNVA